MKEFFKPERIEDDGRENIKADVEKALSEIKDAKIFNVRYLDKLKLVFFSRDNSGVSVYENEKVSKEESNQRFDVQGFMLGLETDYVGLNSREDYEKMDIDNLNDHQFIVSLFCDKLYPFSEFVIHEIGHNVFDLAYIKKEGDFEVYDSIDEEGKNRGEITDCSEEYRDKIKEKLEKLLLKYGIEMPLEKFDFQRQKISEIFAFMVQREFSKRIGNFQETHGKVDSNRAKDIWINLDERISELNKKTGRNILVEDFYTENHILSFIITPILEQEYGSFEDRMNFLELDLDGLKN